MTKVCKYPLLSRRAGCERRQGRHVVPRLRWWEVRTTPQDPPGTGQVLEGRQGRFVRLHRLDVPAAVRGPGGESSHRTDGMGPRVFTIGIVPVSDVTKFKPVALLFIHELCDVTAGVTSVGLGPWRTAKTWERQKLRLDRVCKKADFLGKKKRPSGKQTYTWVKLDKMTFRPNVKNGPKTTFFKLLKKFQSLHRKVFLSVLYTIKMRLMAL